MAIQHCENCRFFYQLGDDEKEKRKGECLRFPPQVIWYDLGDDEYEEEAEDKVHWRFPEVHEFYKYGEWRPILENGNISAYYETDE